MDRNGDTQAAGPHREGPEVCRGDRGAEISGQGLNRVGVALACHTRSIKPESAPGHAFLTDSSAAR